MVPSMVIGVCEWPRTSSAKIDRKRLPSVDKAALGAGSVVAPRTVAERWVRVAFASVLSMPAESICVEKSFFELCGNSQKVYFLAHKVTKALQSHVRVVDVLQRPTVALLAAGKFPEVQCSWASGSCNCVICVSDLDSAEKLVKDLGRSCLLLVDLPQQGGEQCQHLAIIHQLEQFGVLPAGFLSAMQLKRLMIVWLNRHADDTIGGTSRRVRDSYFDEEWKLLVSGMNGGDDITLSACLTVLNELGLIVQAMVHSWLGEQNSRLVCAFNMECAKPSVTIHIGELQDHFLSVVRLSNDPVNLASLPAGVTSLPPCCRGLLKPGRRYSSTEAIVWEPVSSNLAESMQSGDMAAFLDAVPSSNWCDASDKVESELGEVRQPCEATIDVFLSNLAAMLSV
jgi:hypothetical protein